MTDEERRALLREARAQVADVKSGNFFKPAGSERVREVHTPQLPPMRDRLAVWRARADEREARRNREQAKMEAEHERAAATRKAEVDEGWNAWLRAALDAQWQLHKAVHARVIAEERKLARRERAEALDPLLRRIEALERRLESERRGVVDLPNPLRRRGNAA
jgi:hypothetical protein